MVIGEFDGNYGKEDNGITVSSLEPEVSLIYIQFVRWDVLLFYSTVELHSHIGTFGFYGIVSFNPVLLALGVTYRLEGLTA